MARILLAGERASMDRKKGKLKWKLSLQITASRFPCSVRERQELDLS